MEIILLFFALPFIPRGLSLYMEQQRNKDEVNSRLNSIQMEVVIEVNKIILNYGE